MTVDPYLAVDLAQRTLNFDRRYALCIQKLYHRPHFTIGGTGITASIFNRCNDVTVRTRGVLLLHSSCDVITLSCTVGEIDSWKRKQKETGQMS